MLLAFLSRLVGGAKIVLQRRTVLAASLDTLVVSPVNQFALRSRVGVRRLRLSGSRLAGFLARLVKNLLLGRLRAFLGFFGFFCLVYLSFARRSWL